MSKQLIDKDKAFEIYFVLGPSRSLSKLHRHLSKKYPKNSPSYPTLKNWAKSGKWKAASEMRDHEVGDKVQDAMMPTWVDVKVELAVAFTEQIKGALDAGISIKDIRELVAASKELRALLGEGEKVEVEFTGIEYKLVEPKE